jgi:hypothetical protein
MKLHVNLDPEWWLRQQKLKELVDGGAEYSCVRPRHR